MDTYLQNLLERMADRSDSMIEMPGGRQELNPDATYRKANAEASQVDKPEYIDQLTAFIEKSKDEDLKQSAYTVLFGIYSNSDERKIISYCIERLAIENKEWTLYIILSGIEKLKKKIPEDVSIDTILELTSHKKHMVREGAIMCLKNANTPKAEDKLIEIISTSTDPYQLIYANEAIGNAGTVKSIPYLQKLVTYKKQDVAATALNAILKLSDKSYLPLFVDHLENGKLKYIGLEGVIKYGDQNVVPLVEKRVKELVAKKRTTQIFLSGDETEFTVAMNFLAHYSKSFNSIRKLHKTLLTSKWEMLWDNEKQWMTENKHRFE